MSDPETDTTQDRSAPIIITRAWLLEHRAWCDDLDVFAHVFGESAELTRANLVCAARADLDLDWFARAILTPSVWRTYLNAMTVAQRTYRNVTIEARHAYQSTEVTAWQNAYLEAKNIAHQAYLATAVTILTDLLGLPPEQEPHS